MGKFNGLLQAEILGPRHWKLSRKLTFNSYRLTPGEIAVLRNVGVAITASGTISAPHNYITDLGTIPRFVWIIISPQDIARPAVIHDYIYHCIKQYKFNTGRADLRVTSAAKMIADSVFKSALAVCEPDIPEYKQRLSFWFPAFFGWFTLRATDYKLHTKGLEEL